MDRTLMYLSILQTGLTYVAGFATAEYFVTLADNWGFTAVAITAFLLMSSKYEVHKRIEALLGPYPSNEPSSKDGAKSEKKPSGTVGFALPVTK